MCRWMSSLYSCQFSRRYRLQQESNEGDGRTFWPTLVLKIIPNKISYQHKMRSWNQFFKNDPPTVRYFLSLFLFFLWRQNIIIPSALATSMKPKRFRVFTRRIRLFLFSSTVLRRKIGNHHTREIVAPTSHKRSRNSAQSDDTENTQNARNKSCEIVLIASGADELPMSELITLDHSRS